MIFEGLREEIPTSGHQALEHDDATEQRADQGTREGPELQLLVIQAQNNPSFPPED